MNFKNSRNLYRKYLRYDGLDLGEKKKKKKKKLNEF